MPDETKPVDPRPTGDVPWFSDAPGVSSAGAPFAPRGETVGDRVGSYKLLQQIGEGGMGTVWMAEQVEPVRRTVALKVIKAGMDTGQVLARFEAERQALALMDHPNIAKVLDAGASGSGRPYFVMELVKGMPINRFCDEEKLSIRERLELFVLVCQAVQHAHTKGVIHRDIKPGNVLVALYDGRPVPKIIDFGVAKATGRPLTDRTLFTEFGAVVGTLEYMSPEQAELNQLDVDTRSDVYGLGVLLYELLTGNTPLTRESLRKGAFEETLRRIREEDPPRPSSRLSQNKQTLPVVSAQRRVEPRQLTRLVRGDLDWIVMKALEKDRNRRYDTASALAQDVLHYLHDEPVSARPPSTAYRLKKLARKHRGAVFGAGAFVVLLATAAVVSTALAVWARRERDLAVAAQRDSRAVLGYFQDHVLAAARPEGQEGGLGPEVTLRAAVDAAEGEIGRSFAERPLVEASIRQVLGLTYYYLGEGEKSIAQHRRAVELREAALGRDHPDTLAAMNDLALAFKDASLLPEAAGLLKETLRRREIVCGPEHPDTLTTAINLALVLQESARADEAVRLLERALKLLKGKKGAEDPDVLTAMNNLAMALRETGHTEDARKLLETTLELRRKVRGPDHPETLITLNNLALVCRETGRIDEAVRIHEEARGLMARKFGADHPDTLTAMNNLAMALRDAGRRAEARDLLEETLALRRKVRGAEHWETLVSMNNLAMAYRDLGEIEKSIALHEETLGVMKRKRGAEHPDTLSLMNNLAMAHRSAGHLDAALPLLEETLELRRRARGEDHPETIISKYNLALAYQDANRWEAALPLFSAACESEKKKFGPDHPDTVTMAIGAARACIGAKRFLEAEEILADVVKAKREKLGTLSDPAQRAPQRLLLASLTAARGEALLGGGKHEEAERELRESVAIREELEPAAWTTFDARSLLGAALAGERKYAEAESLLLSGYEGLKERESKIPKPFQVMRLREAVERIAGLYEAWGKPEKSAEWRARLDAP